jgi:DNA-binding transcriptional regulator YiaG
MPRGIYDQNKTSPETVEKIRSYPDEMTQAEIARLCNVCPSTVAVYRGASPHPTWCTISDGRGGRACRKLTRDEVEYARRTVGVLTGPELARLYGVSKSCIYFVRHGKTYKEWL